MVLIDVPETCDDRTGANRGFDQIVRVLAPLPKPYGSLVAVDGLS
jgi:hypothetical protein